MKENGNFMKLKVIILTVIIMFPYLILGQYGFVVDYTDGELVKIELDNPENEIAIGTSMNHLTDASRLPPLCLKPPKGEIGEIAL